ncbi:MAG: hypothetical protein J7M17_03600 [Anaerolineae bacterium]|nr:hypothetical protein [Anaerolineae bacterium]
MRQETIERILNIEQDAAKIHDEAQLKATQLVAEAQKSAATLREQVVSEARQQAEQLTTTTQESLEAERAQLMERAEAEAQQLETLAAQHFDQAVNFVLDQVVGRE